MTDESQHSLSYNWGEVTKYVPDIRSNELVTRVRWFINMRWFAILVCVGGTAAAFADIVPAQLNPYFFGATAAFLVVANLTYTLIGRNLFGKPNRRGELKILLIVQMLLDFSALSFLTYACGSVETPIITIFMAHIILATLFFRHRNALIIVSSAWFFASLPLVLEWSGLIPVLSIFGGEFKTMVTQSSQVTGAFVVCIGGAFFVCWYLVNAISRSLKIRELQLEDAYAMLLKMDKEKTQATVRATHELKAPFAAIKSYVYTLRDGYAGELPEKAHKVVSRIGDRCDQLTDKIADIIHLSNLRTLVVTDMNLVPVDVVALLDDEVREGALTGAPRGVAVSLESGQNMPLFVMGSAPHLKTLFSNLIRNAVTYSPDHSRVTIGIDTDGKRASVRVEDEGIGIPEKNLKKIFDEHFRSKNAVAHNANGTGLGLSMVKEIVRLHGADIQVQSTLGKGSRFTVNFDIVDPQQERDEHGEHSSNR